ncbi:glycosyltransferase family 2 protein [Lactiplantibacillus plantarum]|jgi:glycosyltransferase involved in cell wall biosynthesis|uniref:glycosyltransferase family 2 protein n=1 Tax=Lactiplantibacillus plantarum TaxID=1590 RepID=UPI003C2A36A6
MTDLSVIVPMYNAEAYIDDLVLSLSSQTLNSVEFILVDDGSTDLTLSIVQKNIKRLGDSRFQLLHKKNGGVSSARNFGIAHANGKYIFFADSDDLMDAGFLKMMVEKANRDKIDVGFFPFVSEYYQPSSVESDLSVKLRNIDYSRASTQHVQSSSEILKLIFQFRLQGYPFGYISITAHWNRIRFDENVRLAEDLDALVRLLIENSESRCKVYDKGGYHYRISQNSALSSMTLEDGRQLYIQGQKIASQFVGTSLQRQANNIPLGLAFDQLKRSLATNADSEKIKIWHEIIKLFLVTRMPLKSFLKRSLIILLIPIFPNHILEKII